MVKALIFDYDGVIVDSFPNLHAAYLEMCKSLGVKCPPTVSGFRRIYGYNYQATYRTLGISSAQRSGADRLFGRAIKKQTPALYPGIRGVLARLSRRFTLALVTGNHEGPARAVLAKHKLLRYFKFVAGQRVPDRPLHKAQAFRAALARLRLPARQVAVIGDRDIDSDRAQQAGIRNIILVDYGWGHTKRVRHPRVRRPSDLIRAVRALDIKPSSFAPRPRPPRPGSGWPGNAS